MAFFVKVFVGEQCEKMAHDHDHNQLCCNRGSTVKTKPSLANVIRPNTESLNEKAQMCEYASSSTAPFDTKGLFLSSLGIIDAQRELNALGLF